MSVRCINCDYDLRELEPTGNCPECGEPIERSLKGDQLRYANQKWLGTVSLGMRIVFWSVAAMSIAALTFAFNVVLLELLRGTSAEQAYGVASSIAMWLMLIFLYVSPVTLMAGLWLATTSEPRQLNMDSMRPLALRGLSLLVVPTILLWLTLNSSNLNVQSHVWMQIGISVFGFLVVVAHMTLFNDFLLALDRRCATVNKKRTKTLKKYRVQGLGCAGVILVLTGFTLVRAQMRGGAVEPAFLAIVVYVWLAVLSFARGAVRQIAIERASAANMPAPATEPAAQA